MNLPTHRLSMTVLMTPDAANFSGNVHGSSILKLLDQVAYACASRYAGAYVATLSGWWRWMTIASPSPSNP